MPKEQQRHHDVLWRSQREGEQPRHDFSFFVESGEHSPGLINRSRDSHQGEDDDKNKRPSTVLPVQYYSTHDHRHAHENDYLPVGDYSFVLSLEINSKFRN
jgi:hypothetical protein